MGGMKYSLRGACRGRLSAKSWHGRAAIDPGETSGNHAAPDRVQHQLGGVMVGGGSQAELVQCRRMQEVRQIPHLLEIAVGNRTRRLQNVCRPRYRFDGALRTGELDFSGRQRLADFVVQLAGDVPAFLLLSGDEPTSL